MTKIHHHSSNLVQLQAMMELTHRCCERTEKSLFKVGRYKRYCVLTTRIGMEDGRKKICILHMYHVYVMYISYILLNIYYVPRRYIIIVSMRHQYIKDTFYIFFVHPPLPNTTSATEHHYRTPLALPNSTTEHHHHQHTLLPPNTHHTRQ